MGQVTGNNMSGIGQAFNRARQAQQSQPQRGFGGKFNRPQQPQSGGLAGMVNRARQQQAGQAGGLQSAAISDPAKPTFQPASMSMPIKPNYGSTTQPVKPQPARNQAYGRMLGAPMRGRGRRF